VALQIAYSVTETQLTNRRPDNDALIEAFDFDSVKLFDQIGEQIFVLYWIEATETAAEQFQIAVGQESECNDAFGNHDAYLLLQWRTYHDRIGAIRYG
jgi:hypothetical protein